MKLIAGYLKEYIHSSSVITFVFITLLVSCMIGVNYSCSLDQEISAFSFFQRFILRYALLLFAFSFSYWIINVHRRENYHRNSIFLVMLFAAPAIFALKMSSKVPSFNFPGDSDALWNHVLYWPALLVGVVLLLYVCQRFTKSEGFFGLEGPSLNLGPYLLLLVLMLPLLIIASMEADFANTYPKLMHATGIEAATALPWWKALLFELSYGSDFITIELFFRGFLVAGFLKWVGKDAILPMAAFYCVIHFGKPLAECISSYFGGIFLGVIVYNTRSMWGGLFIHVGIAWMMEAAGYLRHLF